MEMLLLQLFIFLGSAAIAVPVAKRLGLGSVLGYLIAGIVIGPFGAALIHDTESVMHFTEFGVVMMLFLVGLELKPSLLWQMRVPILGMGGAQVLLTAAIVGVAGLWFLSWQQAVALGLILSLSSTAIVLQTLREKGLMNSAAGKSVFSVLLFQDLAVIPMLAILPLLASFAVESGDQHESVLFDINSLPGYGQFMATFAAIAIILLVGKYASQPIFRAIAATRVREVFVGTALALVVGIALLMMMVGLSPALGTFLAGVVLADSEYRHELESDIEPFKGLLLGIFFISIGASLNFTLIGDQIALVAGITIALIVLKWLALQVIARVFHMPGREASLFAMSLAQGGEFAFVLFQFAKTNGVLAPGTIDPVMSSVALSMFLAPLLFILYDKLSTDENAAEKQSSPADDINREGHRVILAGFGRTGIDIGRFLISAGIRPVILDNDPANISVLRRLGYEVYYGDVSRLDLLEAAGAGEAELLIVAVGETELACKLVEMLRKHFPQLKVVAKAHDRAAAFELMDLGLTQIQRETFGSALQLGQDALNQLGFEPYESYRLARLFRQKDQELMPELYRMRNQDEESYISTYQQHNTMLEEIMTLDRQTDMESLDRAWTAKNPES